MRYPHVLVCESNESDRSVFLKTLSECYVDHCEHVGELDDLLQNGEYDAIFFGRSSIIEFLDGETSFLERLSEFDSESLFTFRVSEDLTIQVKRMSILS